MTAAQATPDVTESRSERLAEPRRRWPRWPRPGLGVVAGLAATCSALLQLLLHPVLGLADNGDYPRVLSWLGLVAQVPPGKPDHFQYIWLDYVPGDTHRTPYVATETLLAKLTYKANTLLGHGPGMDLRVMGIVQAALLGLAVWLVVRALPGPRLLRLATALLLVVVVTDTRFVVYLDSFYTEPSSLLAMLFLLAAVLHAYRRRAPAPLAVIGIVLAGFALVLAKSQDAILAVPVAVLLVLKRSDVPWLRLTGPWRGRLLGAAAAVVLLACAAVYLQHQPADLDRDNRYNAVFVEILDHSRNPRQDLIDLGLSPELARYAGRPIYLPTNAVNDPAFRGFFDRITHLRVAEFYLVHPGRSAALAHRGATAVMMLTPEGGYSPPLGTETIDSGAPPYYTACKLCLYSTVSQSISSAGFVLVPALWLGGFAAGVALLRLRRRRPSLSEVLGLGAALLLVTSCAVLAMAVALLGEGAFEMVKHLFLASVCNALVAVLALHAAALFVVSRWRAGRVSWASEPAPS